MSAPPPSDAELVVQWRSGDERAATLLVRRYAEPLGRYLMGRGAASAEVDDLLQETFFRAFRGIGQWRGDVSLAGWLYRIAGNQLRDRHRRVAGKVFLEVTEGDRVDLADPEGEYAADEVATRLEEGLAALSPMQREVFRLRVEQGLDYREIALALDTTEGAARVHYHHAVRRLRERLQ